MCRHQLDEPAIYFAPVFRSPLNRMFKQRPAAPERVQVRDHPDRGRVATPGPERAPWRNGEISRDQITVAGVTVTTSIEFSTSGGLLRVVGESHYQESLRNARAVIAGPEPVL